jgi:signal transduction histidine kinase
MHSPTEAAFSRVARSFVYRMTGQATARRLTRSLLASLQGHRPRNMRRLIILFAASLLVCIGTASAQENGTTQTRHVLFLHSFGPHFAPWNAVASQLREKLIKESPYPIDLYETALEGDRFGPSQDQAPFVEYLRSLFAEKALDLVIAIGAPAARFVQKNRPRLFASTPLLISSADERTFTQANLTENDAVVALGFDQAKQIENILQVLPQTSTIAIVLGNSPLEKFWVNELRQSYRPFTDRVTFKWLNELSADEMLEQVRRLPPNSAIYSATVRVDGVGVPQEEDRVLSRIHAIANAPVFTYIDSNFGNGIVGGPMLSTSELAERSVAAAIRILGGESPATVKTPTVGLGAPIYDERELRRWQISESDLPPGSEIRFRTSPLWKAYFWQIALVCSALLGQGGLILGLLYQRRRRFVAEVQARQRMSELSHFNRYSMAGELTTSIAHELNQPLGAILLNTETLEMMIGASALDLVEIGEIVREIRRDDQRASEVLHRLRSLLKKTPFELKIIDINEVVRDTIDLVTGVARARAVRLDVSLTSDELPILGDPIQIEQVIMNFMLNASDAMADMPESHRCIEVQTSRADNCAVVSVSDAGPGIAPDKLKQVFDPFFTTKPNGMGMGLSIARTIIEAHNGLIQAQNRPEGGATFRIKLSLARGDRLAAHSPARSADVRSCPLVESQAGLD